MAKENRHVSSGRKDEGKLNRKVIASAVINVVNIPLLPDNLICPVSKRQDMENCAWRR